MADTWLPIDNGRQQSSYQEYSVIVPPRGSHILNSPFNYCRCLDANQPFKVAWSTNNGQTNFQAGLGVKFDQVIPYVQIFNPSESPLVVSLGLGIGYFDDSRLSVSGTVQTEPAPYSFLALRLRPFRRPGLLRLERHNALLSKTPAAIKSMSAVPERMGCRLRPWEALNIHLTELLVFMAHLDKQLQ